MMVLNSAVTTRSDMDDDDDFGGGGSGFGDWSPFPSPVSTLTHGHYIHNNW